MRMERTEYPRPQFRRDDWMMLNGEWKFAFEDKQFDKKIIVPFSYQYEASGIGETEIHKTVWYKRTFKITKEQMRKRALLCFNGCNYETDVWVNGEHVAKHFGAFAPFNADITASMCEGENEICVRCIDSYDPALPRGKQSYKGEPFACWYLSNGGIWQSVWIEFFGEDCMVEAPITPDIDTFSFGGEIETLYGEADEVEVLVSFEGNTVKKQRFSLDGKYTRYTVRLQERDSIHDDMYWEPQAPRLFYVDFRLFKNGEEVDEVHTRFGMRKISVDEQGQICLNNKPLYQRLILDQGYWKESGLTPPSAEALKQDILMSKEMGFNGARKHQKLEDPYWYYYADELGFLTWCEMPSAYYFNEKEMMAVTKEWQEIIRVAKYFTSVITYVPMNESWGVRKVFTDPSQQAFAKALYYTTKASDASRLVSTNDGWENLSSTDVISIHDYAANGDHFQEKYSKETYNDVYPQWKKLMAQKNPYEGQPVFFSEFGGIAMKRNINNGNWGYGKDAEDNEEFYDRLKNLIVNIRACNFQGYCYTQLTDIQQEVNGLLDAEHKPKFDTERIGELFKM